LLLLDRHLDGGCTAELRQGQRRRAAAEKKRQMCWAKSSTSLTNIPQDLIDKAECVIVLPSVKKFAIGIGGNYGKGAMVCRSGAQFDGPWDHRCDAPGGASVGLQLGGSATDFVLLIMNPKGAESLLGNKVKLGADASAAAGPKGRVCTAATDIQMKRGGPELLASLSCSQGRASNELRQTAPSRASSSRTSAFIWMSVAADASRPFGPAAAEASAPSFTLFPSSDSAPLGFMIRSTKSVAEPPSCKPTLAPSRRIAAGGPQGPSN